MSKILITGATGFIGSWLVKYFLRKGKNIIAHGSSKETINNLKNNLEKRGFNCDNIEFWEQNFLNMIWNFPNLSKNDNIIHCAAATKVREGILKNYDKFFTINVLGTKKLAKTALEVNINHFIHFSTGQIFGHPPSFPITEKTPKYPINIYGFTKLMSEKVVASLGILGLKYTIVRPFSVYGKGHYNIISIIYDKIINDEPLTIFGDGTQSRAFTHVNDICNAIDLIVNNEKSYGEDYNLSGPKEYSVNNLVNMISKKLNKRPKIKYKNSGVNELKRNIADLSKIKKLGFFPQKSLEEFIKNI